ncbi:hypothetical protein H5410_044630 [Solanum commersonii]|uniref:Uncharacterized protein n=1 Tax=Solanum commersonii TaxID=4109 RepID=A0A9J5XAG3_SOLCO|nr:hypothetical protein H5410_044630 [Solanum commersonii]
MENNSSKVEMMKPVFLKAGIPIALTLAGYIIAKITTRKISNFQISPIQENPHDVSRKDENGHQNRETSESLSCIEAHDYDDGHCSTNTLYNDSSKSFDLYQNKSKFQANHHEISRNGDGHQNLENSETLSCIESDDNDHCSTNTLYKDSSESFNLYQEKCKIQENSHEVSRNEDGHQNLENSETLSCIEANDDDHCSTHTLYKDSSESFNLYQEKHKIQEDIKAKFQHYTHLKEKEIALMDMQYKLLLEINKVEFFSKEITLMEAESQRFQNMVIEYLKIMELLDLSNSENSLLQKRVKKLLKKIKEHSRVMKEQKFQLEAKEKEISRNQEGLEMKDHVIKEMELEIQQLKMELELAKTSNQSKNDVEVVTIEDYKELVNELEQLQKEKASEDKELIYLRWCNACLRHELMRRNQEQKEQGKNQELNLGEENRENVEEFAPKVHDLIIGRSSSVGHNESCLNSPINDHSKRRKLMQKFKKWVEGSDKTKNETNCFKRHCVSDHTEDLIHPARKSCSSA